MFFRPYSLAAVALCASCFVGLAVHSALLTTTPASDTILTTKVFNGHATFFFQDGAAGACGKVHNDGDHIVALQTETFAHGKHCGATIRITDKKSGKTATGVVADECPGCKGSGSIDLSQGLFEVFERDSVGEFPVSWHF